MFTETGRPTPEQDGGGVALEETGVETGEETGEETGVNGTSFDVELPEMSEGESEDSEPDGISWELGVSVPPQDEESDTEPSALVDEFVDDLVRPTDESWLHAGDDGPTSDVLVGEFLTYSPLGEEPDEDGVNDPSLLALDEVWSEIDEADADRERPSVELHALEIDDSHLGWEKKRWHEQALPFAYAPQRGLTLAGEFLCLSGESTHLIHHRTCLPIGEAQACAKTVQMVVLDLPATRFLLLTATGRLLLWDRALDQGATVRATVRPTLDRVADIWQAHPGSSQVVVRLETGELYNLVDANGGALSFERAKSSARAIAQSLHGLPRLGLLGHADRHVVATVDDKESPHPLPETLSVALGRGRPLVAADGDCWLVGVRDVGLWSSHTAGRRYQLVRGCRSVTAVCLGSLFDRTVGFVGLFSELDDRADLVVVDLATGKASRIAELRVVTDSSIGDLDSPERARIDGMLWDASLQRLWVVGSFGVSCFSPPSSPRAS
jgi:hypothetical protein